MIRANNRLCVVSLAMVSLLAVSAAAAPPASDRNLLERYARDTWRSMVAMVQPCGLPADGLRQTASGWELAPYTSPSDIAAYLWSTLAAGDLGLIEGHERDRRVGEALATLARLERSHGFFYNWYDPRSGALLRTWPTGCAVRPFLSSVDNGWLAAALMMVERACPEQRGAAGAILAPMDFRFFYDPYDPADPVAHPGLIRGGYWPDEQVFSAFHYAMLNSEPRIASYVGIARGQLPREHYYRMVRAGRGRPADPGPPTRTYDGVPVVEAWQTYRGARVLPTWDGTMFEALMVPLFVPEAAWGPKSWALNHERYTRAQIEYGLRDAQLGYWGVSASADPAGGYRAYGVAALGEQPVAVPGHVVTPHASFLALPFARDEALANLRALEHDFPAYGPYGFRDSVDISTRRVADHILVLDQGMILAAIDNALNDSALQRAFAEGAVETAIRPLIAQESFHLIDEPAAAENQPQPAESVVATTAVIESTAAISVLSAAAAPSEATPAIVPATTSAAKPARRRRRVA